MTQLEVDIMGGKQTSQTNPSFLLTLPVPPSKLYIKAFNAVVSELGFVCLFVGILLPSSHSIPNPSTCTYVYTPAKRMTYPSIATKINTARRDMKSSCQSSSMGSQPAPKSPIFFHCAHSSK